MISDIIGNKPYIKKFLTRARKEVRMLDLLAPSIRYNSENMTYIKVFYVGEDMAMRPDLVSMAAYGNVNDFDVLMKYNGISNPFALNYKDLILVPELAELRSNLVDNSQTSERNDIRNQYIDPRKKSTVDPKKQAYDALVQKVKEKVRNVDVSKYNLPPNISEPGESEGIIVGGKAILGPFIGKRK